MINFNSWQQTLVDSPAKEVTWLFYVIDKNDNVYEWSTKKQDVILGSDWSDDAIFWNADWIDTTSYSFKIISFSGITTRRPNSEHSLIAPNDVDFTVFNKNHTLAPSDFIGGRVWISLYLDNGNIEGVVRRWRFNIKSADPGPHSFNVVCEDFFQAILKGSYPNTQYAKNIFPTYSDDNSSNVKVPIPFGTCYVPLKFCAIPDAVSVTAGTISFVGSVSGARCRVLDSANGFGRVVAGIFIIITGATNAANNGTFLVRPGGTSGAIYLPEDAGIVTAGAGTAVTIKQQKECFLLGPSIYDYDVKAFRRPRDLGAKIEWTDSQNIITSGDWSLLEPLIYDLDGDGIDESPGHFHDGSVILDLSVKFSRSDTVGITNPADVIEWVLKDMGVLANDINSASFAAAAAIFDGWGLEFNGAFWYDMGSRTKALASLLNQCHATLYIDSQINIMILDVDPVATITDYDVLKTGDIDAGTFSYSAIIKDTINDGGFISWQAEGEAQDILKTYMVSAGTTTDNLSEEELLVPFVRDSIHVQTLGKLYFQRKLLEKANISFDAKSTLLGLIPDQFITINQDIFGGNYDANIDSIAISEGLIITINGTVYNG